MHFFSSLIILVILLAIALPVEEWLFMDDDTCLDSLLAVDEDRLTLL